MMTAKLLFFFLFFGISMKPVIRILGAFFFLGFVDDCEITDVFVVYQRKRELKPSHPFRVLEF